MHTTGPDRRRVEQAGGRRARAPAGSAMTPVDLVEVEHLGGDRPLVDHDDVVDQVAHDGEGAVADPLDRGTVDEPVGRHDLHRSPGGQGGGHARGAGRLDADEAGGGGVRAEPGGDPGEQPTAADRDHEGADRVGHLPGDLDGDRPLAGDGAMVVEGVDVVGTGGGRVGHGRGARLVEGVAGHDRLHQVAAGGLDLLALLAGRGGGQEDAGPHAEELAAVGDAEGVVAGTGAHHTEVPLGPGQRRDDGEGPAELVGPADLLVLASSTTRAGPGRHRGGPTRAGGWW